MQYSETGKPVYVRPAPAVNLNIDIENCVKAQQRAGFARLQMIQNLKQMAQTLIYLQENGLDDYATLCGSFALSAAIVKRKEF